MKCKRKNFRHKEELCLKHNLPYRNRFRGKMGKVRRIMPKENWYNYINEKILKPMVKDFLQDKSY